MISISSLESKISAIRNERPISMKKCLYHIILLLLFPILAFSQTVEKQKYTTVIDYINCKCTELSFKDQPRQPNLASFQKITNYCDIRQLNSSFYNGVLIKYLKDKGLFKNEALAKGINTYKVEYKSNYTAQELGNFVVDTLMKQRTMTTFKGKHESSYAALEAQIRKMTFDYLGYKKNTNIDPTNEAEVIRDINHFRDTSRDNYINQDGGNKANSEVETDQMEQSEKDYDHDYEAEDHKSFFEKYKSYLLLAILAIAIGFYWMKRFGGGGSIGGVFKSRSKETTSEMPMNGELEKIKEQLSELRITSVSIQEEMNRLRFRFNELESKVEGRYLDEPLKQEDIELEREDFEVIDLSQESSSSDDIRFTFDDVNQDAIDDSIDPNSSKYTGIGIMFFMAIPDENGNFDTTQVSDVFKRPSSVYEFSIISKDGNQAEFSIYDDIATMIRALDNHEKYIKPACRSNAILHKNATKIITDKKGLAIREGDSWRVIEKAIIRYA